MKLYLHATPTRSIINGFPFVLEQKISEWINVRNDEFFKTVGIEIVPDDEGTMFIEKRISREGDALYWMISSDVYKSKQSEWVKKFGYSYSQ